MNILKAKGFQENFKFITCISKAFFNVIKEVSGVFD